MAARQPMRRDFLNASAVRRLTNRSVEHGMGFSTTLTINGIKRSVELDDARITLLDLLHERLDLTGADRGCYRGQRGARAHLFGKSGYC